MATFTPNEQQLAVFDWAKSQSGSLNLVARAGCGKTSTLVELTKYLTGQVFLGAFNKAIASELQVRIGGKPGVIAGTMHSLGLYHWKRIRSRSKIESRKVSNIVKEYFPNREPGQKACRGIVADAVSYAKQSGFGLRGIDHTETSRWMDLAEHYDLWDELPKACVMTNRGGALDPEAAKGDLILVTPEVLIRVCMEVYETSLDQCIDQNESIIDFDDMILAPLYFADFQAAQYDWVLIDEAQDTNECRRRLAQWVLKPGGRMVAVGDPHQCQPPDTRIQLTGGNYTTIDKLKVGDRLVCYDRKCGTFVGTSVGGFTVNEIVNRHYDGPMLSVSIDSLGLKTRATPNHKFTVRWTNKAKDKSVVYLMRKGDHFRVGWCQLFTKSGDFHLGQRARHESADAAWIIGVFSDKKDASFIESVYSTKFQIPLPQFKQTHVGNANHYTQEFLDRFWSRISSEVPLYENASRLLSSVGLDIQFPIYTGKSGRQRQGRTTVFVTQACNLIPDLMAVPAWAATGIKSGEGIWYPIGVDKRHYSGPVYSLDVDKHHNYVAEGILTNNSVYGFAGASNDAMELIKADMGSVELPLSVTYRCPKAVVEVAHEWCPDIEAHPSAPKGELNIITHREFLRTKFKPTDVILCRNTRPLVGIARVLRKNGIECVVEGVNHAGLIALASKWGEDIKIGSMLDNLSEYTDKLVQKYNAEDKEDKAVAAQEKYDMISDFTDGLRMTAPVTQLLDKIDRMLNFAANDREVLRLCTVHRSKGREWDRVFLVGRNLYMPSKYAKKPWQIQQEKNLMYVAVTRSKRALIEVGVPAKVKNGDGAKDWWEE